MYDSNQALLNIRADINMRVSSPPAATYAPGVRAAEPGGSRRLG